MLISYQPYSYGEKMKFLPVFLVLCGLTSQVYAQETLDFLPDSPLPSLEDAKPEQPASEDPILESEQAATNSEDEFELHIFLNEPVGTHASLEVQNVTVLVQKPLVETKRVGGREVKETRYVTLPVVKGVKSVTAGATIIDCDSIEIQVKTDEDAKVIYEFEIHGKLRLRNGNSKIEAKSAKLSDGKLTLTDVSATTGDINMKSSEVVIDLTVGSFRIGDYQTDPIRSGLSPIPSNGYEPTPAPFYNGAGVDDFAPAFPGATIPPGSTTSGVPEKATLRPMPVY